jgi:predicted Zn-dependent protease
VIPEKLFHPQSIFGSQFVGAVQQSSQISRNVIIIRCCSGSSRAVVVVVVVTTGLLESLATRKNNNNDMIANGFVANSDELALVLGHEVSHLILGHVSKRNQIEAMLRTLEVLLLLLDPTEGLLSLYIVTILAGVRAAVSAAYSRDDEREADELGMILCAMAGCDLTKACHVFYKMAQAEGGVEQASVLSSHPPTLERYQFLTEKAKELTEAQQGDTMSQRTRMLRQTKQKTRRTSKLKRAYIKTEPH